jgi:hypothetical protein
MLAQRHYVANAAVELVALMTATGKWRRRRSCLWLSSELSGGNNLIYHLPSDVVRMCGAYL